MNKLSLYIFTASLLCIGTYLHSPLTVISAVLLWGLSVAETLFNRKNRDSDIQSLVLRLETLEKRNKTLESDIVNVAERAKTILGENW